jgi:16S rRNA processing protein RimM
VTKEECFYLGHVSKTYSFRGEVIVYFDTNEPEAYQTLESVFVEINNKLIPFFIESIAFDRKGNYARIKFEGTDSEEAAKRLLKKELFLPLSLKPESDSDDFYLEDLIHYKVTDKVFGDLGTVTDVIDHPLNPIIQVEGKLGNALIPYNDTFIISTDNSTKSLIVEIPEGLLNLNT